MMTVERIDEKARLGYEWAKAGGQGTPSGLETDMDLLAFNAGVSNANINLKLNVAPYIPLQSSVSKYHDKPVPRSNLSMQLRCE